MERRLARDVAALGDLFRDLDAFLDAHAVAAADAFAVRLAIEELFTNLVRHGARGAGPVLLRLDRRGDRIQVTLTDRGGAPFSADQAPDVDVTAPLAARRSGGLGLHLVRRYMDEVTYEHDGEDLRITAIKRLEARDV